MKIKHLFGLAVIAAMTASCSSNEDLGTAGPGTGTNETGVGYATFTINLPSVSGSRAAGDPTMDEGDAEEYAVTSATALIFQKYGADEGSYKFVESVTLPTAAADWSDDETGGITTTSKKLVAKLTNVDTKNTYAVLVLLNNKTASGVKITLPSVGQSYNDWNNNAQLPTVTDLAAENDFYMANAPLKVDASPTTLVTIDKDNIYPTKEKAEAGTSAATVYVERGVAKISVPDPTPTPKKVKDKATNTETESTVKFSNWALDITNKKTYAVHKIDGLSTDFSAIWTTPRFTGTNSRVYWGKDPNYDNEDLKKNDATGDSKRDDEFNFINATSEIDKAFTESAYCLENTFNLANMYQGQTTRVIFKATYAPKDDAGTSLADGDGTFYTIGNMTTILNTATLKTAVNAVATPVLPTGYTIDYDNLKTEGSHVIKAEYIKDASGIVLDATATYGGTKTGEQIVNEINDKLGLKDGRDEEKVGINTYAKGVTYYIARVKHFGDALHWASGDAYDGHNDLYLGRYGVLRNNWYELTVGNVYGPGYPGVPPVDPTLPDDENEKYLSVSVKILSWAKWSHSYDL